MAAGSDRCPPVRCQDGAASACRGSRGRALGDKGEPRRAGNQRGPGIFPLGFWCPACSGPWDDLPSCRRAVPLFSSSPCGGGVFLYLAGRGGKDRPKRKQRIGIKADSEAILAAYRNTLAVCDQCRKNLQGGQAAESRERKSQGSALTKEELSLRRPSWRGRAAGWGLRHGGGTESAASPGGAGVRGARLQREDPGIISAQKRGAFRGTRLFTIYGTNFRMVCTASSAAPQATMT